MKTFYYDHGAVMGATLTVGELKAVLANYPDEMPVLATWEGITTCFHADGVEVGQFFSEDCLVFDVNDSP